jgi:hypothetical protein
MKRAFDLRLTIEPGVLKVTVVSTGEQDLRLWARNNSWGWSMFSLLLGAPNSDQWRELSAKPVRWTANLPHALNLPAGGQLDYELRREDPAWENLGDVSAWLSQPLQVRVRLRITETPEAVAQGVFIGEALSPINQSNPPHCWLAKHPTKCAGEWNHDMNKAVSRDSDR